MSAFTGSGLWNRPGTTVPHGVTDPPLAQNFMRLNGERRQIYKCCATCCVDLDGDRVCTANRGGPGCGRCAPGTYPVDVGCEQCPDSQTPQVGLTLAIIIPLMLVTEDRLRDPF